jgi:proteasome lid subunit RPN8/RPN11
VIDLLSILVLAASSPTQPGPPVRLVLDSSLYARLGLLAAGLRTEVVLCLTGSSDGPTTVATGFLMPEPKVSNAEQATFSSCPTTSVAMWHNHPLEGLTPGGDPNTNPRDLCALSETDIRTAAHAAAPFVVIAVDANTWCWWSHDQVAKLDAQHALRGDPVSGQIESLTLAGTRPYTAEMH